MEQTEAADEPYQTGTSIFDPVICEIAYRWFCPPDGVVLDPFAGGSVRGIVASHLGRRYVGIELRAEQMAANVAQLKIAKEPKPEWRQGDARAIGTLAADVAADLIFTCPPYWNLEAYSDDPADLSNMGLEEFTAAHAAVIARAAARRRTVDAFEAAGLRLYNDAVLVTAVGSLPIRVRRQFETSRKLGRTHQNVLVFVKGDPRKATEACGPVEFGELVAAEAPPHDAAKLSTGLKGVEELQ